MKPEVPDIVDKYLKIKEFKKQIVLYIYIIVLIVTSAKHLKIMWIQFLQDTFVKVKNQTESTHKLNMN